MYQLYWSCVTQMGNGEGYLCLKRGLAKQPYEVVRIFRGLRPNVASYLSPREHYGTKICYSPAVYRHVRLTIKNQHKKSMTFTQIKYNTANFFRTNQTLPIRFCLYKTSSNKTVVTQQPQMLRSAKSGSEYIVYCVVVMHHLFGSHMAFLTEIKRYPSSFSKSGRL